MNREQASRPAFCGSAALCVLSVSALKAKTYPKTGPAVYSWTKTALFFFRNFSTTRLPLTEVWVRTASGLASL